MMRKGISRNYSIEGKNFWSVMLLLELVRNYYFVNVGVNFMYNLSRKFEMLITREKF